MLCCQTLALCDPHGLTAYKSLGVGTLPSRRAGCQEEPAGAIRSPRSLPAPSPLQTPTKDTVVLPWVPGEELPSEFVTTVQSDGRTDVLHTPRASPEPDGLQNQHRYGGSGCSRLPRAPQPRRGRGQEHPGAPWRCGESEEGSEKGRRLPHERIPFFLSPLTSYLLALMHAP